MGLHWVGGFGGFGSRLEGRDLLQKCTEVGFGERRLYGRTLFDFDSPVRQLMQDSIHGLHRRHTCAGHNEGEISREPVRLGHYEVVCMGRRAGCKFAMPHWKA